MPFARPSTEDYEQHRLDEFMGDTLVLFPKTKQKDNTKFGERENWDVDCWVYDPRRKSGEPFVLVNGIKVFAAGIRRGLDRASDTGVPLVGKLVRQRNRVELVDLEDEELRAVESAWDAWK